MKRGKRGSISFYHQEKKIKISHIKNVLAYLFWAGLAILLAWVLVYSIGIKTSMVGSSMEPTLYNGQEMLIDRFAYNFIKPKHGDVVIFKPNGNENVHFYVKRVIGVPGDTIEIRNGYLYLNDIEQTNLFADKIEDAGVAKNKITLPEDEYFVMGDACNNSEDSRSANIGNVNKKTIYGKAWFHMAAENSGLGSIEKAKFSY